MKRAVVTTKAPTKIDVATKRLDKVEKVGARLHSKFEEALGVAKFCNDAYDANGGDQPDVPTD